MTTLLWPCAKYVHICTAIWVFFCLFGVSFFFKHRVRPMSLMSGSFFPRRDVPDLDQPCLSTSAVHKGSRGKLFILTSFRENKPHTLGASVPSAGDPNNTDGRQLSLCGHNYEPGSGYRRPPPPPRSSAAQRLNRAFNRSGNLKITAHTRYSCPSSLQRPRKDVT